MSISTLFLFLLVLLVLVIVHEFGHFIVAKLTKMRVDEFAFGFPPRIFSVKKGETTYSFNSIPLGGYVAIWGENGSEEDKAQDGAKNHPRAFSNRPWWAQLLVLVAGVTMNMLLALFIFIGISFGDIQMSAEDETYGHLVENQYLMVVDSALDSPAYRAGIVAGSKLTEVKSAGKVANLSSTTSLVSFIGAHPNDSFNITYVDPTGALASTTIAAVYGIIPDKKAIGIAVERVGTLDTTVLQAIEIGAKRTYNITVLTLEGLSSLVKSAIKRESVMDSLSGPVGIARIVEQTSTYGYAAVLTLVAILSINLAIFNILPLPALDGGRMVVVIVETVIGKRIPFKYYSWVNMIGFSLLILLLIFVTINDISR
ncbi:site-2 protease family protein [Candidatus Gracilibacteria bacterium]|nr:site-2 protease family protein [Candidatus Gracilibacteria bacterium]MCF7898825.1 site-2 protease family protein [Candidatus Paceibacterota bacterium]